MDLRNGVIHDFYSHAAIPHSNKFASTCTHILGFLSLLLFVVSRHHQVFKSWKFQLFGKSTVQLYSIVDNEN